MSCRLSIGLTACACLAACSQVESPAESAAAAELRLDHTIRRQQSRWLEAGRRCQLAARRRGTVRSDAGNGFLVTNAFYTDFDLEFEFWVTADANSGAFIRCANPTEIGAATCYEVNIFDQRPDPNTAREQSSTSPSRRSCSIPAAAGTATRSRLAARGSSVTLNGQQTVDVEDSKFASGPIALQRGAGTVMFRNVRIRE